MSEEILKALMQLFALITKQDEGIGQKELDYVNDFLVQQIGVDSAPAYLQLFKDTSEQDPIPYKDFSAKKISTPPQEESQSARPKKLTSVLDSVRVLKLCKQISRTLNKRQKVVVLVRILELVNAEYNLTAQRLSIVDTVSDIFRISKEEYKSIFTFVTSLREADFSGPNHIMLHPLFFLRVPSVELYFVKFSGQMEIFLNGLSMREGAIYSFTSGSSLRLPVGLPVYYSDISTRFLSERSQEKITLEADHLSYTFPNHVQGLNDISFTARQGNLVGIMGSSGAGKTTLMNVLAGMYTPTSGQVRINKVDLHKNEGQLRGVVGFVPQDDLLIEELTVFENLWYNAKFCFKNTFEFELREKVNEVLSSLGLLDKKDMRVGSVMNKTISGGQRKRLNIALELIREPSVLFLDEPTSGLSSRDSENVMDLLRELTLKGKLVFVVIHQPSSEIFKMFDRVVILDQGGHMVYFGNPVEAAIHFKETDQQVNASVGECPVCGNVNPEQIFNIIEARQLDEYGNYTEQRKISPATWEEIYRQKRGRHSESIPDSPPPSQLEIPGWISQLVNYLKRDLKSKINNHQYLLLSLLVSPALAFILAFIVRYIADPVSNQYVFRENENIPIYIFMALIVALFLGLILSAEEIFRDRKILKREKFLHLSRSSYLLAKIGTLVAISAIQTLTFVLVANAILEIRDMTLAYWLALFSTAVCANMIGLVISSAFNSAVTIYIVIPLVMIPMMVLSGAMFSFEKLNRKITSIDRVPLVAELMPTKWSYEALMVHQFKDNEFEKNFYDYEKRISYNNFKSAYLIPELEERLNDCKNEFRQKGALEETLPAWTVLKNELLQWQGAVNDHRFQESELDPGAITPTTLEQATRLLRALKQHYLNAFTTANREKERHLAKLMEDRRNLYFSMLNRYHNESVADQVKKIYEKNQIIEYQGRLYQRIDPIFLDPAPKGPIGIRSHFFAPRKYFLGRYIDTFTFNIAFIWFLTLVFYGVLYYDLLGRLARRRLIKRRLVQKKAP
jgi:ABC-type multidrug transport system ATPase subunit